MEAGLGQALNKGNGTCNPRLALSSPTSTPAPITWRPTCRRVAPIMSAGEKAVAVAAAETVSITLTVKEKDARIVGGLWDPRNQDVVEGVDAGVLAWAGGDWVRTAVNPGNGTYTMSVAAGLWHLGYRVDPQSDYVGLRHHKNIPVASGQTTLAPLPVAERDGLITGTVLGPDGAPLAGAKVIADGIGPVVANLWLSTHSGEDGGFRLSVPHGNYHLGATIGVTDSIKPALRRIYVPPDGASGGHVLQFRWPDAVISGTVSISNAYVVDTEGNRVVMQVDHFTDFALTSEPGIRLFLPVVVK